MKTIGVIALQGAVTEHLNMIMQLGEKAVAVKHPDELRRLDGLIIPGGESTAISRLMTENNLYEAIRQFAQQGRAIFGTCAGLILCARSTTQTHQSNQSIQLLKLIDIEVERNGFGRQIDSFETMLGIEQIGLQVPAIFIRAPYIQSVAEHVQILASVDNHIIMARENNILVAAFHPELTTDTRVMNYFLSMIN